MSYAIYGQRLGAVGQHVVGGARCANDSLRSRIGVLLLALSRRDDSG